MYRSFERFLRPTVPPLSAFCGVKENPGAGTIFVDVLWAMVVLVGCSRSLGGCMVVYRHFKTGGGAGAMYLPVDAAVRDKGCCFCFISMSTANMYQIACNKYVGWSSASERIFFMCVS